MPIDIAETRAEPITQPSAEGGIMPPARRMRLGGIGENGGSGLSPIDSRPFRN